MLDCFLKGEMIMIKKFYTAKYDRVFKTILCDEDDKSLLQEFLSRLLKRKVEVVQFLRNELPVQTVLERTKTVDVLVKADQEYIHIELNSNMLAYLHNRNFAFFSSLYSKKAHRGENYDLETKYLHIDLTYGMKSEEEQISYYIQSNKEVKYVENIEIIEYNMDKLMGYWYNNNEEKIQEYKHLIMLDLETKGLKDLSKGDDFVSEFEDKITKLNEQETFQSLMTYEEDQKKILNTEKKISFEEGRKESQIEIAKAMLKAGETIEKIHQYTELPVEEVNNLKSTG